MKAIKKRLSILLAILMVFTGINPYAVSVKAQDTTSVEILSEEASEAKTPDKEAALSESSQEEKQEAVEETAKEAEIKSFYFRNIIAVTCL